MLANKHRDELLAGSNSGLAPAGLVVKLPCFMNTSTLAGITKLARAAAALLTLGLFTVGSIPAVGLGFPGVLHWIAHLAAFAVIAFAFGFGWPQRPAAHIAAIVAAIGAVHELTQIVTHSHAFETEDVIVNAIGALIGVAIQRAIQRALTIEPQYAQARPRERHRAEYHDPE